LLDHVIQHHVSGNKNFTCQSACLVSSTMNVQKFSEGQIVTLYEYILLSIFKSQITVY